MMTAAGHKVVIASEIAEGVDALQGVRPLVALVHSEDLLHGEGVGRLLLDRGGAMLAYHCDESDAPALPFRLKRATLAELSLPLERHRLLALVQYVESRARAAGRDAAGDDADSTEADAR
jgi:hypothetical protein